MISHLRSRLADTLGSQRTHGRAGIDAGKLELASGPFSQPLQLRLCRHAEANQQLPLHIGQLRWRRCVDARHVNVDLAPLLGDGLGELRDKLPKVRHEEMRVLLGNGHARWGEGRAERLEQRRCDESLGVVDGSRGRQGCSLRVGRGCAYVGKKVRQVNRLLLQLHSRWVNAVVSVAELGCVRHGADD